MSHTPTVLTRDKLFEIHAYLSENRAATLREIARDCGLATCNTAFRALCKLEAAGVIERVPKSPRARRLNYTACYLDAAGGTGPYPPITQEVRA